MLSEFIEVTIKEATNKKEEKITYYILEDEGFGIQISKKSEDENSKENELVMHNIVNSRKEAEDLLNNLIKNSNDLTQTSYIIEDYLNNKNSLENKTLIS